MIRQHRRVILKAIGVFLISYLLFLIFWITVKDSYGRGTIYAASKLVAGIKDVKFQEMTHERDGVEVTFAPLGHGSDILIDIPVKISSYTFNAPLTFAIMASLYPFLRRKPRAYGEALSLLLSVHLLYLFSLEAKELTDVLTDRAIQKSGTPTTLLYQFLWSFTDNMVIRFEPFLIGLFLFLRFRK
ncbi:MAG TPA: hypothetical protein VFG09_08640 [Thermodesulfovibrionales bacterium]|nr:hypothetical protein [Thermodesulfovibrionales bacterium]